MQLASVLMNTNARPRTSEPASRGGMLSSNVGGLPSMTDASAPEPTSTTLIAKNGNARMRGSAVNDAGRAQARCAAYLLTAAVVTNPAARYAIWYGDLVALSIGVDYIY